MYDLIIANFINKLLFYFLYFFDIITKLELLKEFKMSQDKNEPVPTGPMYIGICTTRAQAIAQRWQGVVVFIAANTALANILGHIFEISTATKMFQMLSILAVATFFNYIWFKLIERANSWIEFYTVQLIEIEKRSGTESGVTIFSSEFYPSVKLKKGEMRSSVGIRNMIGVVFGVCVIFDIVAVGYILYQLGKGNI